MNTLWQLRNPLTNENLSEPQLLPENWGPICGLEGIKDKLGDLSWIGITDKAWFEVGPAPSLPSAETLAREHIAALIEQTNWMVSLDNTTLDKGQRAAWVEYRQALREIPLQGGFPNEIFWPSKPE